MEVTISIVALIVAIASAYFTYQSRKVAEKANSIAIHDHQKEIFNSFNKFRAELIQLGEKISKGTLQQLSIAAHTADLYLEKSLADKIKEYSTNANHIYFGYEFKISMEKYKREMPKNKWEEIFSYENKCHALEKEIESGLRDELRLAKP